MEKSKSKSNQITEEGTKVKSLLFPALHKTFHKLEGLKMTSARVQTRPAVSMWEWHTEEVSMGKKYVQRHGVFLTGGWQVCLDRLL